MKIKKDILTVKQRHLFERAKLALSKRTAAHSKAVLEAECLTQEDLDTRIK